MITLFCKLFFYFIVMANPYAKYLGAEDKLQHAVTRYLDAAYPAVLYTHPNNEGRRTPFERYKIKLLGVKAGVPDILIFTPNDKYNGLAIELKVKYNKPTDKQQAWLKSLQRCKWHASVQRNLDDVIALIDNYLKNKL